MIATLIVLVLFGVGLLIVETVVPGGILGTLGILSILLAVGITLTADELDPWSGATRTAVASGIIVFSAVSVMVWMRWFGVALFRRTFTLSSSIKTPVNENADLIGTVGRTLTELSPLGRVELDNGERHEVRAWSGVIPADTRIKVIRLEPGNLVVKAEPN